MKNLINFSREEDGAVTVDWVVLTAAIVALALAVIAIVQTAATDPANGLGASLTQLANNGGGEGEAEGG